MRHHLYNPNFKFVKVIPNYFAKDNNSVTKIKFFNTKMWMNITILLHKWITYLLQDFNRFFIKKAEHLHRKMCRIPLFLYPGNSGTEVSDFI